MKRWARADGTLSCAPQKKYCARLPRGVYSAGLLGDKAETTASNLLLPVGKQMSATEKFIAARQFLLNHRTDYEKAYREFRWPDLTDFNWARDWFDVYAQGNAKTALWLWREGKDEVKFSYQELAERSESRGALSAAPRGRAWRSYRPLSSERRRHLGADAGGHQNRRGHS